MKEAACYSLCLDKIMSPISCRLGIHRMGCPISGYASQQSFMHTRIYFYSLPRREALCFVWRCWLRLCWPVLQEGSGKGDYQSILLFIFHDESNLIRTDELKSIGGYLESNIRRDTTQTWVATSALTRTVITWRTWRPSSSLRLLCFLSLTYPWHVCSEEHLC